MYFFLINIHTQLNWRRVQTGLNPGQGEVSKVTAMEHLLQSILSYFGVRFINFIISPSGSNGFIKVYETGPERL